MLLHGFECLACVVGLALCIEHPRLADEGERGEGALGPERGEALVGRERFIEFPCGFQVGRQRVGCSGAQRMRGEFFEEALERRRRFLRFVRLAQFIGEPQVRDSGGRGVAPIGDDLAKFLRRLCACERLLRAEALPVFHELERTPHADGEKRKRDDADDQLPVLDPKGEQIEFLRRRRGGRGAGSRRVWLIGIRIGVRHRGGKFSDPAEIASAPCLSLRGSGRLIWDQSEDAKIFPSRFRRSSKLKAACLNFEF